MSRKLVFFAILAGGLILSADAFAINHNGKVVIGGPSTFNRSGAARNHGVAGAGPFYRGGGAGGRLPGGPHVGGASLPPKR